ncbi:MAG: glycosyltransferase family A protein [Ginsengibacter sp.]
MLLTIYSILALAYWVFLAFYLLINGKKIQYLSSIEVSKVQVDVAPSVAIVIAIRNEEYSLRDALTSVCNLNYGNYKVLAVNDRSTDNSGKILSELAAHYQNLAVINIESLPGGWLGKNYALYTGSISTGHEYLLFTDADVLYKKDLLSKSINYCLKNDLDHLTVLPGILSRSAMLKSLLLTFIIMLTALLRPWAAKIKTSSASMGVGAFNLVKRNTYKQAGTHKAIAMRPDDDLKLAENIKAAGGSSDVLYGLGELELEWYASIKEFINGLMKNTFSGFNYNIFKAIGAAIGILVFFVLPLPAILIFGGFPERILAMCMLLFQAILYGGMPGANGKWWYSFLIIYTGTAMIFIIIKSAIVTLYRGGIYWRDTFYSLAELRKKK